jgi:hypothetical protein
MTTLELYRTTYSVGHARSPGAPSDQDSHRGELTGLLGAMFDVQQLCNEYHITSGGVTLACDNDSALLYAFDTISYPDVKLTMPDYDMIQAICHLRVPNISYNWHFVQGHRDEEDAILDTWETLNIAMDLKAKGFRDMLQTSLDLQPNWYPALPGDTWSILLNHQRISKNVQKRVLDHISSENMQAYWTCIQRLSVQGFGSVDWTAIEKAMLTQTVSRRHWISKHASNNCGINTTLVKRQQKQSDACIRCGASETAIHVWTCHHNGAEAIWDAFLKSLGLWLRTTTSSTISQLLVNSLRDWRTGNIDITDNTRVELLQSQDAVGWDHILEGCISQAWRNEHQQHLATIKCNKSRLKWTVLLIQKFWGVAWELWQHRNHMEHASDTSILMTNTNSFIAAEFSTGFAGLDFVSHLFREEELQRVSDSSTRLAYKQEWLKQIKTARGRLHRLNTSSCSRMRTAFRNYFGLD